MKQVYITSDALRCRSVVRGSLPAIVALLLLGALAGLARGQTAVLSETTWGGFGNDLLKTGSYRRAVRFFSKSLRLYPTDVWALNNRGLAYVKLGKQEKAQRDFEAALRIDPGFEQARRNLEGLQSPQ